MNAHDEGLKDDYSDFHSQNVLGALGVGYRPGFIAVNALFLQLIARALSSEDHKYGPSDAKGEVSDKKDLRLAKIYAENIKLTTAIDQHFGVKAIFVPQLLNFDWLEQHYQQSWWPFISVKGVRPLTHDLNLAMEQAAKESGAVYLIAPLSVEWGVSDFADQVHFSAAGSEKFARTIAAAVASNCQ
jgi:hypothetical protein